MLNADELEQACDVLVEHEGLIPWLYCDVKGYVTVGVGDKVSSNTVATMPFVRLADGTGVDAAAKVAAFGCVRDFYKSGLTATAYCAVSDLRLPVDFCRRRLVLRLKSEFLPAIERLVVNAASLPTLVKLCLVDIAYNVGVAGFARFEALIADCNSLQFGKAAQHVHTKKVGEDPANWLTWGRRNKWRRLMMFDAWQAAITQEL
jgi:hypothetical protein